MHLIVASHRRSGTHLTIDGIINNFSYFRDSEVINLDTIFTFHEKHVPFSELRKVIEGEKPIIIKTHLLPEIGIYGLGNEETSYISSLFQSIPILYAYRNGLDVMVSLQRYMRQYDDLARKSDFPEFIFQAHNFDPVNDMSRIDFWAYHVDSWMAITSGLRVLPVKFEDWISDFESQVMRIADFTGMQADKRTTNITMQKRFTFTNRILDRLRRLRPTSNDKRQRITAILPHKGSPESWRNYFDKDLLSKVPPSVVRKIADLGYGEL